MIRVRDLDLPLGGDAELLRKHAAWALNIRVREINGLSIAVYRRPEQGRRALCVHRGSGGEPGGSGGAHHPGRDVPVCPAGLYPCGEGAGCAGGIVSAAVDGIRVAEAVAKGD